MARVRRYDIVENAELWYKDVTDGCSRLRFGIRMPFGPIVAVGGHCSLQAFDAEGSEVLWSVVGDTVSALAIGFENCCADLLVATEDHEITAFSFKGGRMKII